MILRQLIIRTVLVLFLFPIAARAEWKFTNYPCIPKTRDEVRVAKDGAVNAALWFCDRPAEISAHWFTWSDNSQSSFALTTTYERVKLLLKPKWPLTPAEIALLEKLYANEGVKVTVSTNGQSQTRPIYAATSTNTRGADTGQKATVGTPCKRQRLVDANGKATSYFAVEGGYTLCKVSGVVSK